VDDLINGQHVIKLTVTDTIGAWDEIEDPITITINGRPTAPEVTISPSPAVSGNQLTANVTLESEDPEGDLISYRYDWFQDDTLYASGSSSVIPPGVTVRDQNWRVVVTPNDEHGEGDPGDAEVTIINSGPSVDSVALTPTSPYTTDDIAAVATGWEDQDEDTEAYNYRWEKNGSVDPSVTADSYPWTSTVKGDEIRVRLVPDDGLEEGTPVFSSPVVVINSPPDGHTINLTPASPEPGEDLLCTVTAVASDADGDDIDYTYSWSVDGTPMSGTDYDGPTLDGGLTENGETWECTVTASDEEDIGGSVTESVYVSDGTIPDPPVIDEPAPHRNAESVDLNGECEAECTLTFYCEDSSSSWTFTDSCTTSSTFGTSVDLVVGDTSSCYATCTDSAGNVSGPSNLVTTEVCDPQDVYEVGGYGDDPIADPIDEWAGIPDDGSTSISITGNVLDEDDEDWYIISATDDLSADLAAGIDYFRFGAEIVAGDGTYSFRVYKGDPYPDSSDECTVDTDGYTEFEWFNQDLGDSTSATHVMGSPLNACGPSSGFLNHCADDSDDFYIQVFRNEEHEPSCTAYELEITNGEGW